MKLYLQPDETKNVRIYKWHYGSKKYAWVIAFLLIFLASCKKKDSNNINPVTDVNSLGLALASPSETVGVLLTPNYIPSSLPSSAVLSMPPIGNQGAQGSCVSWSTAYAGMSYFMNRSNGTNYSSNQQLCSPKYVYNQISQGACNGTSIPQNLNILLNKGVCTLADMPYNDYECSTQPGIAQNNAAGYNKIFAWKMVDKTNINVIKSCIIAKCPVFIAVMIDASFDNLASPYIWNTKYGAIRGGHALTVIGYDDTKQAFKIQNSWGPAWKDNGCLWISYSFFPSAVVGSECYIAYPKITNATDNINNGIVLNMPFNGNATDASGNNNNGTVNGATLTSDHKGNANSAYKFAGVNSPGSITIPSSTSLNSLTSYTISFWARFDGYSGEDGITTAVTDGNSQISWQTIFYRGGNVVPQQNTAFRLWLSSLNNSYGWYLGSNGYGQASGVYTNKGEWHHYIFSKTGTSVKYYIDGVLIWDLSPKGCNFTDGNNYDLMIGRSAIPGNGVAFNGAIDELLIYNRAITAGEAQLIYKAQK